LKIWASIRLIFGSIYFISACRLYYEETGENNPVDLLLSGIHAADYVEAASLGFASEVLVCQTVNKRKKKKGRMTLPTPKDESKWNIKNDPVKL
jgi:hypothetical protein